MLAGDVHGEVRACLGGRIGALERIKKGKEDRKKKREYWRVK